MCNRLRLNLNSTDESQLLKTPSPPIMFHNDVNARAEQCSTNDLSLTSGIPESFDDSPILSDAEFEQLMDEMTSNIQQPRADVGTMAVDIEGLKKYIRKQNKSIKRLDKMVRQNQAENKRILQQHGVLLERILSVSKSQTSCNPLTNETIPRLTRSDDSTFSNNDSTSAVGLSIDEIPTTSQGSSIEMLGPTENLIRADIPSFSRPQETIEYPTTMSTLPKFNNPLSSSNIIEIKPLYPEKNRGKIPLSQWCHEIYVGTTDDVPALLAPTNPKIQIPTEENSINYQLSRQLKTTIRTNPSSTPKNQSIRLALLHPLQIELPHQTDRHDTVLDCYGKAPVLLVLGGNLPTDIPLQIAAVSNSSNGRFWGAFYFHKRKDQCDNFYSRVLKKSNVSPQRFELHHLELYKKRYSEWQGGNTETFKLTPYPSGSKVDTCIINLQTVLTQYGLKQIQLAFQIADQTLYSNVLSVSMEEPKKYSLRVLRQPSINNALSFDSDYQCPMKFTLEIPEPFHCTFPSGWKWIEVAVVSNGFINPLYSIDTGNGERRNPNYLNVNQSPFDLSFKIVKQLACEMRFDQQEENAFEDLFQKQNERSMFSDTTNGDVESILGELFSKIQFRFRLIHSEIKPDLESKTFHDQCKPVLTNEFTEGVFGASIYTGETSGKTGQKRLSEVFDDDGNEMTNSKRT